jgi:hypothetical protein
MIATLVVGPGRPARSEETVATCGLLNSSREPIRINLASLSSPSLALEIMDDSGEPVPLPPPPVPTAHPQSATLEPGQRYEIEYVGFVPSWTPAGTYRARCRYVTGDVTLHSNWITFELT